MARTPLKEPMLDVSELKIEQMMQVIDIIRMAQRAKRTELLTIKAGLDAAFGDDWRNFKPPAERLAAREQAISSDVGKDQKIRRWR